MDALISTEEVKTQGSSSINNVEVDKIKPNPNQPRREFDHQALQDLSDSIRQIGLVQPITIRDMQDGTYIIIAGERRWRASQMAGLTSIPAYIRTVDDENMMEMALVENIQREDLNPMEIALAYQHLLEQYEMTQEQLSERVGKSRSAVTNALRLRFFQPKSAPVAVADVPETVVDENVPELVIGVEGMMCHHCTAAVEKACKGVPGVLAAAADLEKKQVTVRGNADLTALENAIIDAGYTIRR